MAQQAMNDMSLRLSWGPAALRPIMHAGNYSFRAQGMRCAAWHSCAGKGSVPRGSIFPLQDEKRRLEESKKKAEAGGSRQWINAGLQFARAQRARNTTASGSNCSRAIEPAMAYVSRMIIDHLWLHGWSVGNARGEMRSFFNFASNALPRRVGYGEPCVSATWLDPPKQ